MEARSPLELVLFVPSVSCQLLARMSTRITNEVPGVNRVVLDVTSKPSGTIKIVE